MKGKIYSSFGCLKNSVALASLGDLEIGLMKRANLDDLAASPLLNSSVSLPDRAPSARCAASCPSSAPLRTLRNVNIRNTRNNGIMAMISSQWLFRNPSHVEALLNLKERSVANIRMTA